ncbi:MAG: hypothetical protein ACLRXJ_10165 [Bifidobacterium bifidum]
MIGLASIGDALSALAVIGSNRPASSVAMPTVSPVAFRISFPMFLLIDRVDCGCAFSYGAKFCGRPLMS